MVHYMPHYGTVKLPLRSLSCLDCLNVKPKMNGVLPTENSEASD